MGKGFVRDGHVRAITLDDVKPGVVLREVSRVPGYEDGAIVPAFADAVVLKVDPDASGRADATVTLARPYLYATGVGTTSPTALVGFEKVEVQLSRLVREDSIYMLVVGSRGQAFTWVT